MTHVGLALLASLALAAAVAIAASIAVASVRLDDQRAAGGDLGVTPTIAAWPEPSWQAADEPAHRRTMNEREIGIEQMIRLGSGEYEMPEWALTQLRITTRMCDHELVAHIEELLRLGVEVASWPDRDTLARITAEGEYRDALEAFAALAVDRDGLLDAVQPDTPQAPSGLRVVR